MSKTQKKFVQQEFPSLPLLSEKEIRHVFKYTDLSAVEVTSTIFGKAKIRKAHPSGQMKLRWLALIIFLLILAGVVWFTIYIELKVNRLSTPTIETVVVPLSQTAVKLVLDDATTGRQSTTPTVAGSAQTNPAKMDFLTTIPEKINQVKTKQTAPDVATQAGEVKTSRTNANEVKKTSVLKPSTDLSSDDVHTPTTEMFQNEENVAPAEGIANEPAPTFITQPNTDSKESSSE